MGAAIKEIIHYKTIRGKFSSVHPDLAAEGITRVEVGEEGLHFIRNNGPGLIYTMQHFKIQEESCFIEYIFTDDAEREVLDKDEDEEETLRRAIAMSLEVETEEKESFSIKGEFLNEMSNNTMKTDSYNSFQLFQMKRWLPTCCPQATMTMRRRRC